MKTFPEWLNSEIQKKQWIPADLAKKASVSPGVISRILSDERKPTPKTLTAIAQALGISEEEVFSAAGLLKPQTGKDARTERLMYQIEQLDEDDQETIATLVGALVEKRHKKLSNSKTATT